MSTGTIPRWFELQMARMSGLRYAPSDLTTHWEGLSDVPEAVMDAAVGRAQRAQGDFPTPDQLRAYADRVRSSVAVVEPVESRETDLAEPFTITVPQVGKVVSITREWAYYCDDCSDSGWFSLWCGDPDQKKPWVAFGKCERNATHAPHEYVQRCHCYESNRALIRKREAMRKYAEEPAKK